MANTDAHELIANATTFLFVPGNRPDRFAKAFLSSADLVILDLEDAVAADAKADALRAVTDALTTPHEGIPGEGESGGTLRAIVRVNADPARLGAELEALRMVASHPQHALLGLMLPKAERAHEIAEVISLAGGLPVIPLIETALGLVNVNEIAGAPGVARLAFGAVDFARDLDATEPAVFDHARAQMVISSRAAGLTAPIDSPCVSIDEGDVIVGESRRAAAFGFAGKMCIHPSQLEHVNAGFAPTADQVAWAEQVVALEGGAAQLNGQMIDKPVVGRAKSILDRHRKAN